MKTTALFSRIRNAYEIRETGVLLNDAERRLTELEQSLKTQEKQLPILEETRKTAENAEEQKKLICDQELQNCSKISEKVQKALELFEQIKRLHTQAEALATENTKKVRKQQEALEEQETQWKKQSEELAEVDKKLVLAENKKQEADAVSKEIVDVQNLRNQAEQCRKKAIKTRETYANITKKYNDANTEYEEVRLHFLNAQAGFLAAELESGKPCPVCGSTEHPHPAKKGVESVDISEEKLQNMIFEKFLGQCPSEEEMAQIKSVDDAMLFHEFKCFMNEELDIPEHEILTRPAFSTKPFEDVEEDFLLMFHKISALL